MTLYVNGSETEVSAETLEQLIEHYELKKEHVVAEVNGHIIDRNDWSDHQLQPGDKVELVHFVGGG